MTRVSRGVLDTDNLGGALKATQDAIAAWLGVDDGKAERAGLVVWVREQRKGPVGVEIRIEPKETEVERLARALGEVSPEALEATRVALGGHVVPPRPRG